jgi:hypothetical protein
MTFIAMHNIFNHCPDVNIEIHVMVTKCTLCEPLPLIYRLKLYALLLNWQNETAL